MRKYQSHGIRIVGSAIVGLPEHTPENIDAAIEYAAEHDTDIMQFMLYIPAPGTELFARMTEQGVMTPLEQMPVEDWHGQFRFNYQHPHIPAGLETVLLQRAFERDFERNGPSLLRMFETQFTGYLRYKHDPDPRIRERFARATNVPWAIFAAGMTWAAQRYFARTGNARVAARLGAFLQRLNTEFGWKTKGTSPALGRLLGQTLAREERRQLAGVTDEPRCSVFKNRAALKLEGRPAEEETPWAVCAAPARELASVPAAAALAGY